MTLRALAAAFLAISACASRGIGVEAPTSPAGAPAPVVTAMEMRATIYDDGLACPGGCDAHVVFHPSHNGTANAYEPGSDRTAPRPCRSGMVCTICFGAAAETCMLATYRGAGPARGRFDMTPALFETRCGDSDLPATFAAECRRLAAAASRLGYDRRLNCLAHPTEPRCALLLAPKRTAQRIDRIEREKCLDVGSAAYNERQLDPQLQRTPDCSYFLNQKGRNAAGETWFKLAPAACRKDTFVGRDGLDCCSSSMMAAAALHPECRAFFLEPR